MSEGPFELVSVPGGARSLRSREHGETFHPGIGPMEEARILHVAQHRLEERLGAGFVVWDVGLGAGANALAMIEAVLALGTSEAGVELRSFDQTLEPLRFALMHAEDYGLPGTMETGDRGAFAAREGDNRERDVGVGNGRFSGANQRMGGARARGGDVRSLFAGGESRNVEAGGIPGDSGEGGWGLHAHHLLPLDGHAGAAAAGRMVRGTRSGDRRKDGDDGGRNAHREAPRAAAPGLAGAAEAEPGRGVDGRRNDDGDAGRGAGGVRADAGGVRRLYRAADVREILSAALCITR